MRMYIYVNNNSALIVKRAQSRKNENTEELQKITESLGYNIIDKIIQTKEKEDREYNIGQGKLKEIKDKIVKNNITCVVIGNRLNPYQMYNISIFLPKFVTVKSKNTVLLDLLEYKSKTKKSKLQIKLAKLRYELPRAEIKQSLSHRNKYPGNMNLKKYNNDNTLESIKSQIKHTKNKLNKINKQTDQRIKNQKNSHSDIISLAGYVNTGKSMLLRRLAKEHSYNENTNKHNDISNVVESGSSYFTTLETVTRKMDYPQRDILIKDTIGYVDNLPYWLKDSFVNSFNIHKNADLVLLVIDASKPIDNMIQQTVVSHDNLTHVDESNILTVFNKCDEISSEELQHKKESIQAIAPNPVCISGFTGENIDVLKDKINNKLIELEEDTLILPQKSESMPIVSWIYDNAYVKNCEYMYNNIMLEYKGKHPIIKKAKYKAKNIN